jgi:nicotinamide riboside kinase
MKTKIINFVASPSTGKSLMSALTFVKLKSLHKTVEYVQEFAKMLIYQDKLEELNNQYNVSYNQYKMIKSISGKVEYITLDSPMILGMYYNKTHPNNVSNIEKTEKMILEKMNEFDNIYILLEKNEKHPYEKTGRIHNEEEAYIIQKDLEKMLKDFNIPYLKIKSDIDNIDAIIDYILKK